MIRRGDIDYLCLKSVQIKSKKQEFVLSEPSPEAVPRKVEEIPEIQYDTTFKIVIFGDSGVHKQGLTEKFLTNTLSSDSTSTIGVDLKVKGIKIDGNNVKLEIWDFGGEERFKFLLPIYARGAKGGFFIYDIKNSSSLAHIEDWLTLVWRKINIEKQFPIIMVGIMHDDENERQISAETAIEIAKSKDIDGFIECNINTGENVEEAFEQLTKLMLDNEREKFSEELREISDLL